ncbi:MAG: dihydroorotate dehydrogenase [Bacteroidota bacterium]|nr:dihydroorotate dehydrogenase [Bacteroidota bacterium]
MKTDFRIGSLSCKNRVLTASGTFGYGLEAAPYTTLAALGGIVTKSVTKFPRAGNPPPRIAETTGGMLNSIGLANVGVEAFARDKLPLLRGIGTAVIVNIAGSSIDEYIDVLERLEHEQGIDAWEINISCPNVREGGLHFGAKRETAAAVTRALRPRTRKPLIVKLTPNVTQVAEIAAACADEGADAVSLINTLVGMAVDVRTRRPRLSTVTGGLSGPAVKPVALAKVYETARAVSIPVIGIGGIVTAMDAIEFLLVGATAVQVGTSSFRDPDTAVSVARGMEEFCREQGVEDIKELVGALRVDDTGAVPGFIA